MSMRFQQRIVIIGWALVFGMIAPVAGVGGAVRVAIEGLEGDVLENVRLHVGEPISDDPLIVNRFARRIPERVRESMAAVGYYEAGITVRSERDDEVRILRIIVDPGEPVRIGTFQVSFEGDAADDEAFIDLLDRRRLREGDRLHHGRYTALKRAIENLALSRGYFDGRFVTRRIAIDRGKRRADIVLTYDGGTRYRMGNVIFPETPLRETFLQQLVPFQAGVPYDINHITRLNRNLLNSGYFRDVRVRPQQEKADDDLSVPVDADITMDDPNKVGIGIGMTTDVGPRMRLNWRRPWVNRRGHLFGLESEWSEARQNVSAQYTIPLRPPLDHRLQFLHGWQREESRDKDIEKFTLAVQRERTLREGWLHHLFVRYEDETFVQADVRGDSVLLLPGTSISRTRTRGGRIPERGDKLFGSCMAAHSELGSNITLARFLTEGKLFRSFGRHQGRVRVEYGALATEDFDQTPPSLRFFAGGDHSVRGFAYESLSPRDEDGNRTGGRFLFTTSIEYNYALTDRWRAAVFTDIGNAAADIGFEDGLEQGVGIGVRWQTPVGPLRVDLASGIGDPIRNIRVHISMGAEI